MTEKKPDSELRIRRAGSTVRRNLTLSESTVREAEALANGRSLSLVVDEALGEWVRRETRAAQRVTTATGGVSSAGQSDQPQSAELATDAERKP
ncbi:hypothetical protein OG618_37585 (plasmid) [Kitasatospora sp. NBC_01246]|uniref:hypothetical protein n=1 Tax=Kitasatospora sp. NBC_01246 TaxID=2903570 RepID=UPI002E329A59|nr:hypothetical protein [Kitasatospora sp. NBC_01246]